MPYPKLILNDGTEIPQIGFGTGSVWKGQEMTAYVKQALDGGFTHIDCAQYYQTEDSVGAALAQSKVKREDVYITTKYGMGSVRAAMEHSLSQLGVSFVDLYLIHNPRMLPDIQGTWCEMEALQAAGLATSIGVSNFDVPQLELLLQTAEVIPAVNQIRLHPYNYAENRPLLAFCAAHGIVVEAYNSLAPITSMPGGPVDAPLAQAAQRIGGTPAQVIFAWLARKGIVIVTTSSKAERLAEYLAVPDLPPLTDAEVDAIEAAGAMGFVRHPTPPETAQVAITERVRLREKAPLEQASFDLCSEKASLGMCNERTSLGMFSEKPWGEHGEPTPAYSEKDWAGQCSAQPWPVHGLVRDLEAATPPERMSRDRYVSMHLARFGLCFMVGWYGVALLRYMASGI